MQKTQPDPVVENELFDDEHLLWWGKPAPLRTIRGYDLASGAFGLAFAGFALVFLSFSGGFSVFSLGGSGFGMFGAMFTLIPLGFLGVGLWQASAPVRRYLVGMNTTYALTDQRAIIITGGFSSNVRSYYARDIERVQRRNHPDGSGDVIFSTEQVTRYRRSAHSNWSQPYTATIYHGFFGIAEARRVEDMMVQLFIQAEPGKEKRQPQDDDGPV